MKHEYNYTNYAGHYVVYRDGVFCCTCDTVQECRQEIQNLKKEDKLNVA